MSSNLNLKRAPPYRATSPLGLLEGNFVKIHIYKPSASQKTLPVAPIEDQRRLERDWRFHSMFMQGLTRSHAFLMNPL